MCPLNLALVQKSYNLFRVFSISEMQVGLVVISIQVLLIAMLLISRIRPIQIQHQLISQSTLQNDNLFIGSLYPFLFNTKLFSVEILSDNARTKCWFKIVVLHIYRAMTSMIINGAFRTLCDCGGRFGERLGYLPESLNFIGYYYPKCTGMRWLFFSVGNYQLLLSCTVIAGVAFFTGCDCDDIRADHCLHRQQTSGFYKLDCLFSQFVSCNCCHSHVERDSSLCLSVYQFELKGGDFICR